MKKLRELQAAGVKASAPAIKKASMPLYSAMMRHFGSIEAGMEAAGIAYKPQRKWDHLAVFDELRRLWREGEDICYGNVLRKYPAVAGAAIRFFGSYGRAIETLGFSYETLRKTGEWDKPKIIDEIRKLARSGIKTNYAEMNRKAPGLMQTARLHFGTVRKAMKEAGVEYQIRKRWSKRRILNRLRELYGQKEDLSAHNMHRRHGALLSTIWRIFGSYRRAVEKAGIDYTEISRFAEWDKRTVLRKLRQAAAEGAHMSFMAFRASHPRLLQAAERIFGSYPNARVAAGVGPAPLTQWDQEKVIAGLREVHGAGGSLASSRLSKTHPALADAAAHYFGSYARAMQAAGFDYEAIRLIHACSDQQIVSELRTLDAADQDIRGGTMQKAHLTLYGAAIKHFGSYVKALQAAGLDVPPKKPLTGFTKSQVLARLRELHGEGEDLRYSAMKVRQSALFFAARYYFDAYITAVKRAGLDYDRIVSEQLHGRRSWRKGKCENATASPCSRL